MVARLWNREDSVVQQLLPALTAALPSDQRESVEAAARERFEPTAAGAEAMRAALRRLAETVAGFASSPQVTAAKRIDRRAPGR